MPSPRTMHLLLIGLLATGCPADTTNEPPPTPFVPEVGATLTILDPVTGMGMEGLTVDGPLGSGVTASDGTAELAIEESASFELRVTGEEILPHVLYGRAEQADVELVTFVGSQEQADQTLGILGLNWAPGMGMLVVGIDYEDWSPVAGATASLTGSPGDAFVVSGSGMPSLSSTIPDGGVGMVSFANVPAGSVSLYVSPPPGIICPPYPASGSHDAVPVYDGEVTVVTARCVPDPGQGGVR